MENPTAYIPMDRRQAMVQGATLPVRARGAALFADISGFTPLTEALAADLGPQRGAEELTRHLNSVYDALIAELYNYRGTVIGFSGDAITCWLDGDSGTRAAAAALDMQRTMQQFSAVATASGKTVALAVKIAVAAGPARRFLVGDPHIQVIDVLSGPTLDRLAEAEHLANKGEIVLDPAALASLRGKVHLAEERTDERTGLVFGVMDALQGDVEPCPWPAIHPDAIGEALYRPWLVPPVYERLRAGQGEFLAELRPAVALFLRFGGIDYDDKDAEKRLDAYVRQVQQILSCYEGTLIQLTIGDKGSYLYAAFGAPIAHEDDERRAASAALDLQAAAGDLDFPANAQIGISTGRMRTGAYGSRARRTYGVLGDETNVSARLMQAASAGQILATQRVFQAAGDSFVWERLPDLHLKGKSSPVAVARLAGRRERPCIRLQEPTYRLPMVGRQSELALIEAKLDGVLSGNGQIVGITAEAGMGKSRLVAEAIRSANDRGLCGFGGECQAYGTNTSYLVWRDIWRGLFGIDPSSLSQEQLQRLESELGRIDMAFLPRLPLLGSVLGLHFADTDLTRQFDAKLRKTSLESLLAKCLRAYAIEGPLLLVLEDCHWLDALSHDLLDVLGRSIIDLPVLLVLAYRPPAPGSDRDLLVRDLPHFTEISLTELSPQEAELLIRLKLEQATGRCDRLPGHLAERITARSQGNPFYIEELLNYVRDRGIDPADEHALDQLDLPTSLHSLVLSRVDRLMEGPKATLRVASVVGRVFKAAVLWDVHPQLGAPPQVLAHLDVLSRLDLTPVDSPAEQSYLFKHIVTQEVAYESLPFATRAILHDHIGRHLERVSGENLDQYVDLLAHHYDRSQNLPKRLEYLRRAGEAAQNRYANAAAIDYYQRLLPLMDLAERVPVMLQLGQVLKVVGRWQEAGMMFRDALSLAQDTGDLTNAAWCQTWIAELLRKQGSYAEAAVWFGQARAGFESLGDRAGIGQVLNYWGSLANQQANNDEARSLYAESLEIRRALDDKPNIASLLSNLGIVAYDDGDFDTARTLLEESLAIRRELGNRWAMSVSLNNLGNVALAQGRYTEARAHLEQAIALQREIGDRWELANSLDSLGNVTRAQGDYAVTRDHYREGLNILRFLGDKWLLAYLLEDSAGLMALCGEAGRALRLAARARALREEMGAPLPPPEQERLDQLLQPARAALGAEAQAAAWAEGSAMTLDEATAEALAGLSRPAENGPA
jgi:adenylate cyclase